MQRITRGGRWVWIVPYSAATQALIGAHVWNPTKHCWRPVCVFGPAKKTQCFSGDKQIPFKTGDIEQTVLSKWNGRLLYVAVITSNQAEGQLSHNQNAVQKWSTQNYASRTKKAAAAIYGWDRPLLIFTYPGFDCGSTVPDEYLPVRPTVDGRNPFRTT